MINFKRIFLRYGLFAALATSLGLQLSTLGKYSFWFDESYTSAITQQSAVNAVELTAVDVHPPLYYVLLSLWRGVFGASDVALRSMSVLFAMISIVLLYVLLRRFTSKAVALSGVFVAAIAPYTIRYAQEARMYTLSASFILGSTLLLVILMQRKSKDRSIGLWLAYGAVVAASLYTHYFSSLILIPHFMYMMSSQKAPASTGFASGMLNRFRMIGKGKYFAGGLAAILFAPWLRSFVEQLSAVSSGFWIPSVTELSLTNLFGHLIFSEDFSQRAVISYAATVLMIGSLVAIVRFAKKQNAKDKSLIMLLLSCFILPVAALVLLSICGSTSYFYVRYFAQFSLFIYAAIGVSLGLLLSKSEPKKVSLLISFAVIASLLFGTVRVLQGVGKSSHDIKTTFQIVNENFQDGDLIVAVGFGTWFDASHYNGTSAKVNYVYEGHNYGSLEPIFRQSGLTIDSLSDASGGRVWLVSNRYDESSSSPHSWGEPIMSSFGDSGFAQLYDTTPRE